MIRRAEVADQPWIIATGAEAYADLGDYTRILPSWLEQPGVLAWIDHDVHGPRPRVRDARLLHGGAARGRRCRSRSSRICSRSPCCRCTSGAGSASKLLDHVIEVAERVAPTSQIQALRLTVAENNIGAQRLYERAGFTSSTGRRPTIAASARCAWCARSATHSMTEPHGNDAVTVGFDELCSVLHAVPSSSSVMPSASTVQSVP